MQEDIVISQWLVCKNLPKRALMRKDNSGLCKPIRQRRVAGRGKQMKLEDARAECRRWLAHLKDERKRTLALQEIAFERRRGLIDDLEARRRTQALDRGVTVYDASMLAEAVKVLLRAID